MAEAVLGNPCGERLAVSLPHGTISAGCFQGIVASDLQSLADLDPGLETLCPADGLLLSLLARPPVRSQATARHPAPGLGSGRAGGIAGVSEKGGFEARRATAGRAEHAFKRVPLRPNSAHRLSNTT